MKQIQSRDYEVVEMIGKGNFGTILKLRHTNSQLLLACKMEIKKGTEVLVKKEYEVMKEMERTGYLPRAVEYWETKTEAYLVMELLRANIEQIKVERGTFSMRTVSLIAQEIFTILESCHSHGYIHRDIKPENILIQSDHKICFIDFGLSKKCTDKLPPKTQKLIGNVRYASRDAHFGDSHKKGDLESACYMLIYLFAGYLPWQRLPISAIQIQLDRINSYSIEPQMTQLVKMKNDLSIEMFEKSELREQVFMEELLSLTYHIQNLPDKMNINYQKIMQRVDRLLFISDGFNNRCYDWCKEGCQEKKGITLDQLWSVMTDTH